MRTAQLAIKPLGGDQSFKLDIPDQGLDPDCIDALAGQQIEVDQIAEYVGQSPEFWSSYRLWTCRWPGFRSPFCALPVTVNLDDT